MRYHLRPVRTTVIKRQENLPEREEIMSAGEMVQKREALCTVGGTVNRTVTTENIENSIKVAQKIKNRANILT